MNFRRVKVTVTLTLEIVGDLVLIVVNNLVDFGVA